MKKEFKIAALAIFIIGFTTMNVIISIANKNTNQQETNQKENSSVSKESTTPVSNTNEQSNQKIQELEQQMDELKKKQKEEEEKKKQDDLNNYKSYVFDMVNTDYTDLVGHMSNLTSSGVSVDIMESYFDVVKTVYDSGFNSPPPGGEKIHQAGKDALKAILDMKPSITLKNSRCFAKQKTSQSFSIVTNKMKNLSNALNDN